MLLDDCDTAGEEVSEGLLRAKMACVSTSQTAGRGFETAFESYWLPRRYADGCCPPLGHPRRFVEASEEGAFASFRVANRENEVLYVGFPRGALMRMYSGAASVEVFRLQDFFGGHRLR